MEVCWLFLLLSLVLLTGDDVDAAPPPAAASSAFSLLVVQTGNPRKPFSMRLIRPAVELAVQTALEQYNIRFLIPDGNFIDDGLAGSCGFLDVGPNLGLASRHLSRLKKVPFPLFFLGPYCNTDMAAIAMLSVAHNVMTFTGFSPEIQYMLGSSSAVNRLGYSMKSNMQSILQTCLKYEWTTIAVIWYQWDANNATDVQQAAFQHEGRMSTLEQLIMQANQNLTKKIKLISIIHNNFVKDGNNTLLNLWKASNTSRVIVLLTGNDVVRRYMVEAYYQGYTNAGYVFFAVDFFQTSIVNDPMMVGTAISVNSNWTTGFPDNISAYIEGMKSLLVVTLEMYADDPTRKAWLATLLSKTPENRKLPASPTLDQVAFMANAYDSIIILAYALRQHLKSGGKITNEAASNDRLTAYFYNQYFNNSRVPISTKHFFIDKQGDKRENYYIYSIQDKSLTSLDKTSYQRVGKWNSATNKLNMTQEITWCGGSVPLNVPLCGYLGTDTSDPSCVSSEVQMKKLLVGLATSIPLAMLLVATGCLFYRQHREERRITREWLAQPKDLMVVHPDEEYRARKDKLNKAVKAGTMLEQNMALNDGLSMGAHSADGGFGYSMNRDSAGRSAMTFHSGGASQYKRGEGMRSDTGFWRKVIVTVRWSHKKHIFMSRKVLREIRQVRGMEHDNLCIFAGACIAKDTTVVLYEYCPRGTLQDLINNQAQKFEWTMRIAFLEDILQGLIYLQNSGVGYHGRLTSDCCHIDRRFLMKLSDYGLPSFFSHNMLESWLAKRDAKFLESQLWQAPELIQSNNELADGPSRSIRHGPELDVYSYGIILQEVILRTPPYSMYTDLDHDAISTYLRIGRRLNDKPLRPFFPPDMVGFADASLMELAEKCWSENPRERPKLSSIKECVKAAAANMNIKDSGSIMDMLLTQMEQQNARLQAIVEEKGRHILDEKLKADKVIHACLQKDVAEKLKQHQDISPEAMEIVTILLVQIAQFERILADSTPNQLIDVLNDYNLFIDKAVARFDCHKIDSELDLITVASGVPNRNGILNAREICRLALTLQYRIRELRFHHRPNDPIKLQMGVHSGPCVSAVVGRMIPRYTLFGDTIDITKRMLSTGTTQKIHISTYTKDVLETFGSFRTEERGEVFVKGKGALTTYWLTGEDGNKELKTLQTKYEASLFLDRDQD